MIRRLKSHRKEVKTDLKAFKRRAGAGYLIKVKIRGDATKLKWKMCFSCPQ